MIATISFEIDHGHSVKHSAEPLKPVYLPLDQASSFCAFETVRHRQASGSNGFSNTISKLLLPEAARPAQTSAQALVESPTKYPCLTTTKIFFPTYLALSTMVSHLADLKIQPYMPGRTHGDAAFESKKDGYSRSGMVFSIGQNSGAFLAKSFTQLIRSLSIQESEIQSLSEATRYVILPISLGRAWHSSAFDHYLRR